MNQVLVSRCSKITDFLRGFSHLDDVGKLVDKIMNIGSYLLYSYVEEVASSEVILANVKSIEFFVEII